jgi:hypothetical protein
MKSRIQSHYHESVLMKTAGMRLHFDYYDTNHYKFSNVPSLLWHGVPITHTYEEVPYIAVEVISLSALLCSIST